MFFFLLVAMVFSNSFSSRLPIVTVDSLDSAVLMREAEAIGPGEMHLAREISEKLFSALEPYFPAAGLAAPQIGIGKAVFIFSYDRDPKHLEAAVNPSFIPVGNQKAEGWEGCFSVILSEGVWKLAKVARYEAIRAVYFDLEGRRVERVLEGFAAKVFQHECDHLRGVVNIEREDVEVKAFASKGELTAFLQAVKKQDSLKYIKPPE